MMEKITTATLLALTMLSGCDSSEVEDLKSKNTELVSSNNQLMSENETLRNELNNIKFGPNSLLKKAKADIETEDLKTAVTTLNKLISTHPLSDESAEGKKLLLEVNSKLDEQRLQAEATKKAEQKKLNDEINRATSNLEKDYDKINQVTFYKPKNQPLLATYIQAYIGHKNGTKPWLRMIVHYYSEDWLFVSSYLIHIDGKKYPYNKTDFKRDNGSGSIWEWEDRSATDSDISMLKEIINSKETIIRFNGNKYYNDHTVTQGEKSRLKTVLIAYEAMLTKNQNLQSTP